MHLYPLISSVCNFHTYIVLDNYRFRIHITPKGIPTLTLWRGLCGHVILTAVLAVAYATGRDSHARQVKGNDPDKQGYPGPPGWGFGVRLTTPPSKKKKLIVTKVEQRKKLERLNDDGRKKTRYKERDLQVLGERGWRELVAKMEGH